MIRLWRRFRAWLHWEPPKALPPFPETFVDLLTQCRAFHVAAIRHGETVITFQRGNVADPLEPPAALIDSPQVLKAPVDLDACTCGHSIFEHTANGCGRGCPPSECTGRVEPTPEA